MLFFGHISLEKVRDMVAMLYEILRHPNSFQLTIHYPWIMG